MPAVHSETCRASFCIPRSASAVPVPSTRSSAERPEPQEHRKQRIYKKHHQHGKDTPQKRIPQTHIALEIESDPGIIPPFLMKNFFQQEPRDKLYERTQDHSSQKQEKEIVCKLRQKDRIGHRADPIDRAQGPAHKAPVNKSFPLHRRRADLAAPTRKGIDKEKPHKLIERIYHL